MRNNRFVPSQELKGEPNMLSQYTESYLAETASGRLCTPGTYLAGVLRGRARSSYNTRYRDALVRSLKRVGAVPVTSMRGYTAYVRPAQPSVQAPALGAPRPSRSES